MTAAFVGRGHSGRGDFDLSRRRRCRSRGARQLRSEHDLWRHGHGRALQRQSARAGSRSGLQQDPARRRRGRSLGRISRSDGRKHLYQQRPRLHQLLRHLGLAPHARNRQSAGRAAWPDRSQCRPTIRRPDWRPSRFPARRRPSGKRSKPIFKSRASTHARRNTARGWSNMERCGYLRPTVVHCDSPASAIAKKEYMFPFATVVRVPAGTNAGSDRADAGLHCDHRIIRNSKNRSLKRRTSIA